MRTESFIAHWQPHNQHLQERSIWDYSVTEALNEIFIEGTFFDRILCRQLGLGTLAGRLILQSPSAFSQEFRTGLQRRWEGRWGSGTDFSQYYEPVQLDLTTPDGARIEGTFYRSLLTDKIDIPTVVVFNTNGGLQRGSDIVNWLIARGCAQHQQSFHVATVDYRGNGGDGQLPSSANDLLLDADALYQYLINLKISPDNIGLFGRSLGGAVAAGLRGMHPSNAHDVNSHSFSSLEDLIQLTSFLEQVPNALDAAAHGQLPDGAPAEFQIPTWLQWLAYFLSFIVTADRVRRLASWALDVCHWDFPVQQGLASHGNKTLVIYDEQDPLIQGAGAHRLVADAQKLPVTSRHATVDHHNTPWEGLVHKDSRTGIRQQVLEHLVPV